MWGWKKSIGNGFLRASSSRQPGLCSLAGSYRPTSDRGSGGRNPERNSHGYFYAVLAIEFLGLGMWLMLCHEGRALFQLKLVSIALYASTAIYPTVRLFVHCHPLYYSIHPYINIYAHTLLWNTRHTSCNAIHTILFLGLGIPCPGCI